MRKINGLLNKLTIEKFDSLVHSLAAHARHKNQ